MWTSPQSLLYESSVTEKSQNKTEDYVSRPDSTSQLTDFRPIPFEPRPLVPLCRR